MIGTLLVDVTIADTSVEASVLPCWFTQILNRLFAGTEYDFSAGAAGGGNR